jgi:hypothetical protein
MGDFWGAIVKICGGCGGRPNLGQAGGHKAATLPEVAIRQLREGLN